MQAGVDLTHVWVREAGSGLAVVDSGEDLAGAVVYLGGVQKTLTLRRAGRFVANLTSSEVDGLQEESAAKDDPVAEEGKGDGDERVTRGTDCVYDVQISQDTIPATGGTVTIEFQKRTWLGGCLGDSVNWKFFGDNVSWITHNRDYFVSGTAFRTVFDVAAYEGVAEPRTGEVWVIDHHNDDAAVGRTTITQARVQHAPTIKLSCDRCDDVTPGSAPVDLITVASDGNGDDDIRPNWAWTKVDANGSNAGVWQFGPRGRQWDPPDVVGTYTIGVTITDTTGRTASDSVNIDVAIFCGALVSGILTDEGDGTGFLSTAERGFLHFKLEEGSHASCPVTVSSFRSTGTWVRGLSAAASTRVGWDRVIEFEVDANPTSVVRSADVWLELKAPFVESFPSQRVTLQQAGAVVAPVASSCPATPITDRSTSWRVGDRYYGSGFTQPWAYMGYDGAATGCRGSGVILSNPGRVRLCGFNAGTGAGCAAAARAVMATSSTDPTVGAVHMANGIPVAQWVEFLVQESATAGTLSLAVGTSESGEGVWLHFGYAHAEDLSYGDADYARWGVSAPTWTLSTTTTGTWTSPTLSASTLYPGMFRVECAATNGNPATGFSVSATVTRSSVTYGPVAVDHDTPAPAYTRICKP